jgi:Poxvirus Late Transcription Factor VLTF3 like
MSKQITIDEKHTEMLQLFYRNETVRIPELQSLVRALKLDKDGVSVSSDEYMTMADQVARYEKEISSLGQMRNKYLLDNSKFVFEYFEEKKEISEGGGKVNVNILNNFFKIKPTTKESVNTVNKKYIKSKNIYQTYWKNVNCDVAASDNLVVDFEVCKTCSVGELIPQDDEGILICNNRKCGVFIRYIVDTSKPTSKDPPNEVSYTAYMRLNHFKEILSQFQAKETTQIPEGVIEAIQCRIKKERIEDVLSISYEKMREILRTLGYNKYFEHIQYIKLLFGIKPPIMNEELHETLCVLFIEIQKPWAIHCPANRRNFFNYTYILYQLCVLIDQLQYLPYILLMKDLDKQREQDQIWKKVCGSLNWAYIPSI